jgi:hypothetical protein
MDLSLSAVLGVLLKGGAILLVFNEVRGLILAGPVLYGIYQAGGSLMAIWLGIALSVVVPLFAVRKLRGTLQSSR